MSVLRHFLRDTQTNAGTGGIGYDLSETQGTSAPLSTATLNDTVLTEMLWWQITVDNRVEATTFPTSVSINALTGTVDYRWRIQKVSSANAVLASSAYSSTFSNVATNAETLTLSTTWAAGDRFRLSFEIARGGGHGNVSATLNVNDLSTYADIDLGAHVNLYDGRFFSFFPA